MVITAKDLRGKPGEIIEQAARGTEVVITIRGKKMARLVPYEAENARRNDIEVEDEIFGLWKDRECQGSVEDQIRSMRKRRAI